MDGDTLRSRVAQLVQRTRRAVRLYSSAERLAGGEQAQLTGLQLEQWQQVNTELQRQLAAVMDHPNQKLLAGEVVAVRDRFYHEWRNTEAEVHLKQGELLAAAEKADFIRCAILGRSLVVLKAREQAAQAAHHELQELVERSRIDSRPQESAVAAPSPRERAVVPPTSVAPFVEAQDADTERDRPQPTRAKVIPLRRQGM